MNKLSRAQQEALTRCSDDWQSAYSIGATLATLDALVRLGELEHHAETLGALFSPRTANYYRLKTPNA